MNPLKRKLVDHPKDWPWSSFSSYSNLKNGLIQVDPIRRVTNTEKKAKPSAPFRRGGRWSGHPEDQNRLKRCATRRERLFIRTYSAFRVGKQDDRKKHHAAGDAAQKIQIGLFGMSEVNDMPMIVPRVYSANARSTQCWTCRLIVKEKDEGTQPNRHRPF
jgi:hypothetical protein